MNRLLCLYHLSKINIDVTIRAGPFPAPSVLSGSAHLAVGSAAFCGPYEAALPRSSWDSFSPTSLSCLHEKEACIASKDRLQPRTKGKVEFTLRPAAGRDTCA